MVFGVAVDLLDVELRNGAMVLVRVASLEKMVNVGITRAFAVDLVVGVEGSLVGTDGGTVGVGVSPVGAELGKLIVTPALSQELSAKLIASGVRSDESTFRVEAETYSGNPLDYNHV